MVDKKKYSGQDSQPWKVRTTEAAEAIIGPKGETARFNSFTEAATAARKMNLGDGPHAEAVRA
jgi:hypothetical protein